jgi:hypothetical protein
MNEELVTPTSKSARNGGRSGGVNRYRAASDDDGNATWSNGVLDLYLQGMPSMAPLEGAESGAGGAPSGGLDVASLLQQTQSMDMGGAGGMGVYGALPADNPAFTVRIDVVVHAKGLYISDLNNMTLYYFYFLSVSLFLFLSRIISRICTFLFVERFLSSYYKVRILVRTY